MRRREPGILALMLLFTGAAAQAHDSGFGHSRRTIWVAAEPDALLVEYRLTQNADEALVELAEMDGDGDGRISADEREQHFAAVAKLLNERMTFDQPPARLPAQFLGYRLDNGLTQTFRFRVATGEKEIRLEDGSFPHKPGQVRIVAGSGVKTELAEVANPTHIDWLSLKITRSP